MDPRMAARFVRDELLMDGNPSTNLASFVTTYMEPEAEQLMMDNMSKVRNCSTSTGLLKTLSGCSQFSFCLAESDRPRQFSFSCIAFRPLTSRVYRRSTLPSPNSKVVASIRSQGSSTLLSTTKMRKLSVYRRSVRPKRSCWRYSPRNVVGSSLARQLEKISLRPTSSCRLPFTAFSRKPQTVIDFPRESMAARLESNLVAIATTGFARTSLLE